MSAVANITEADIAALRQQAPHLFGRPLRQRLAIYGGWALFAFVMLVGLWRIDASPMRLLGGIGKLGMLLRLMLPPSTGGVLGEVVYALLQTLAMAFIGSFAASVVAVPFGFLGARNITPLRFLRFGLRRLYDVLRGVDVVIWALLFVNAVGLGPFAGILAIFVGDLGTLSKIYAETIENIDPRPAEAVRAAGSSRIQMLRLGVVPQIFPIFLGNFLYFFEVNVRSAAVLGLVGAEGIGFQLSERIRLNDWPEVCFILILLLVTVGLMDWISRSIRAAILRS
jgi:phosphonate transport system permease protein